MTKKLAVRDSSVAGIGRGCFATEPFRRGETVGEYTGDILTEAEAVGRGDADSHHFLFAIGDDLVIDPRRDPTPVKFINHSCSPNCESEQDGRRVFIVAIRDIEPGEELFFDYLMEADEGEETIDCRCGAPNCRGTMRGEP